MLLAIDVQEEVNEERLLWNLSESFSGRLQNFEESDESYFALWVLAGKDTAMTKLCSRIWYPVELSVLVRSSFDRYFVSGILPWIQCRNPFKRNDVQETIVLKRSHIRPVLKSLLDSFKDSVLEARDLLSWIVRAFEIELCFAMSCSLQMWGLVS